VSSLLDWSLTMQQLFDSEVLEPVRDDPRTDRSDDLTLGYPFAVIRDSTPTCTP